jgi:GNAT superfamily N-acetyltransferase
VVDVRGLQERAARGAPACVEEPRGGDWLRLTDSAATPWSGAALLHGDGPDLAERVAAAEGFYADHRAPAWFQVCPACPPGLDGVLAERGYLRSGDVHLLVRTDAEPPAAPELQVHLSDRPDEQWLAVLAQGGDPAPFRAQLERVALSSAYATAGVDGRAVAVGRAVAEDGWTGVFGMTTLPQARRRGAAVAVLAALADWAGGPLYLQVVADNAGAEALYRRAGFVEAATYHYRTPAQRLHAEPGSVRSSSAPTASTRSPSTSRTTASAAP